GTLTGNIPVNSTVDAGLNSGIGSCALPTTSTPAIPEVRTPSAPGQGMESATAGTTEWTVRTASGGAQPTSLVLLR
ncbi:MAG TPA: hypothetical protein VNT55_13375, partial [Baekduia sp.]|nr:hypothetical protein [Baekduia sp.]